MARQESKSSKAQASSPLSKKARKRKCAESSASASHSPSSAQPKQRKQRTATTDETTTRISEVLDKKFQAFEKKFEEKLEEKFDKKFQALEEKLDKKFQALEEKLDKKFQAFDKKFQAFDKKFQALEENFVKLKQPLEELVNASCNTVLKQCSLALIADCKRAPIYRGASSVWSLVKQKSKLFAVTAAHCAIQATSSAHNLTVIQCPQAYAQRVVSIRFPKETMDYATDLCLVELKDPKQEELKSALEYAPTAGNSAVEPTLAGASHTGALILDSCVQVGEGVHKDCICGLPRGGGIEPGQSGTLLAERDSRTPIAVLVARYKACEGQNLRVLAARLPAKLDEWRVKREPSEAYTNLSLKEEDLAMAQRGGISHQLTSEGVKTTIQYVSSVVVPGCVSAPCKGISKPELEDLDAGIVELVGG